MNFLLGPLLELLLGRIRWSIDTVGQMVDTRHVCETELGVRLRRGQLVPIGVRWVRMV